MLLTLTTTHQPATDLGYLLHKHPDRVQSFDLGFGKAHVVWPLATAERATVALLLDIDPIALVRGRTDSSASGVLDQYVNDRPYVASSLVSVALSRVMGTALNGTSRDRPELIGQPIPLEVGLSAVPCRGGAPLLRSLFEPLGYEVEAQRLPRDETVPEWGDSPLHVVTLRATLSLPVVLRHLYVLLPVLDDHKHYWVGKDEVEKLLAKGAGWLEAHPEREMIADRYLKRRRGLVRRALAGWLSDEGQASPEEAQEEVKLERPMSLNQLRMKTVRDALLATGARRVLDLGCGEGRLLKLLLEKRHFTEVVGVDVSIVTLERAEQRLGLDRRPAHWTERLTLLQGSLSYRDERLDGFDAAAVVEVIEHMELDRLGAFARGLFGGACPQHVVITTPNVEYNALFEDLPEGRFRHGDHRFEWDRATFESWARNIAEEHGYDVVFSPIGPEHPEHGAPTQMGVFSRCR